MKDAYQLFILVLECILAIFVGNLIGFGLAVYFTG